MARKFRRLARHLPSGSQFGHDHFKPRDFASAASKRICFASRPRLANYFFFILDQVCPSLLFSAKCCM
jgi:hypothetical protein